MLSLRNKWAGIQLSLASFLLAWRWGKYYMALCDRFGRKLPLLVGLSLFVIASLACSFASTMNELIMGRFVQGFGGCAGMVISRAIVRDRCSPTQVAQAFSMLILVMGLAPILAP
ncbi:MAG: MFS transporter [Moraxellaceae bacterium]|nr:MFS transporter [Moraxellaceae bacterium]